MASGKRTIRASEIGSFLYCHRAWWYQRQDMPTINTAELEGGEVFHRRHVSQTAGARTLKLFAWVVLFITVILTFIFLASYF